MIPPRSQHSVVENTLGLRPQPSFPPGSGLDSLCLGKLFNLSEPHSTKQCNIHLSISDCLNKRRIYVNMSSMEPASERPSVTSPFSPFYLRH